MAARRRSADPITRRFITRRAESIPEQEAVRVLLAGLGEDYHRPGLRDTPRRVVAALREMTSGYKVDIEKLLRVTFDEGHDAMVVLSGIEFTSLCEHHVLPFRGTATVGYVPRLGRVIGLSKLARIVDAYARRLQVQERLTDLIANTLMGPPLLPVGVGVVVRANHMCMAIRGACKPRAEMVTSVLLGVMRERPEARAEFLALAREG